MHISNQSQNIHSVAPTTNKYRWNRARINILIDRCLDVWKYGRIDNDL